MAGNRRTGQRRVPGQPPPPKSAAGRPGRIRATMLARYADATTEPQRLAIAKDYALSAHADAVKLAAVDADMLIAEATRALIAYGDQLLALLIRGRP